MTLWRVRLMLACHVCVLCSSQAVSSGPDSHAPVSASSFGIAFARASPTLLAHAHPRTGAQSDVRVPLRTAVTAGAYRRFVRRCGASPHSCFGCIPGFTPLQMSAVELNVWSSAKICTICWLFRFGFAPGAAFSVVHAVQHRILTHGVCRACMMAPVTTRAATLVLRQSRLVDPRLVALIRVIRLKEPALTAAN